MVSEDIKPELKTEAPKSEPRSGSKHRRSESQDTNVTEESTDAEDYLKPDELVNCICGFYEENGLMIQVNYTPFMTVLQIRRGIRTNVRIILIFNISLLKHRL